MEILASGRQHETVAASEMFERFNAWAKAANYQCKYNLNSFSDLMKEFSDCENSGLSKKKTNTTRNYQIDAALLKKCLKERDEFDEDANNALVRRPYV